MSCLNFVKVELIDLPAVVGLVLNLLFNLLFFISEVSGLLGEFGRCYAIFFICLIAKLSFEIVLGCGSDVIGLCFWYYIFSCEQTSLR
jgi:hypothetical protein